MTEPREWTLLCRDADETRRLAGLLAEHAPDGVVLALDGPLGAGKTLLVQALAAACGAPPGSATSPTFVLAQEYVGRRRLIHLDAYRIADLDELTEIGFDELIDDEACLICIEWAERIAGAIPTERTLWLRLDPLDELRRQVTLRTSAERLHSVAEQICDRFVDE